MPADIDTINKHVVGWMQPIYTDPNPRDPSRPLYGLGPKDFGRVMSGYGCPSCLAIFDTYLPVCPACGLRRDLEADIRNAPQHWVDHLADRQTETVGAPVSIDEFLAEVANDPDIEHRKL